MMRFTVLIPTFRRPKDLQRCLDALKAQSRMADEVIVTVRDIDAETQEFLDGYDASPLPLRRVPVFVGGVVAAMQEGLQAATGDLIAITDDDTVPYPDWLERMEAYFAADPLVGGVGGRDWQPIERGDAAVVGIVQFWGRVIGNHHLGAGPAREVDVVKGANCAYRGAPLKAIGFDQRLLGAGAQVNWELGLGLAFRRAGWKLIYDPAIALDHFPAVRFDDDLFHRGIFTPGPHKNTVHNGTLYLWEHFSPLRRIVFFLWFMFIGTRNEPGLLLFLLAVVKRNPNAFSMYRATMQGRFAALKTARETPLAAKAPPDALPPDNSTNQA